MADPAVAALPCSSLSLGLGSNALKSLTKLQLVDVKVDLSGLIPGAKLDLDLLP